MLEVIQMEVDVAEGGEFFYECPYGPVNMDFDEYAPGESLLTQRHLVMLEDISGAKELQGDFQISSAESNAEAIQQLDVSGNYSSLGNARAHSVKIPQSSIGFRVHFRSKRAARLRLTIIRGLRGMPLVAYQRFKATWKCEVCKRAIKALLRFVLMTVGVPIDAIEPANIAVDAILNALHQEPIADFLLELGFGDGFFSVLTKYLEKLREWCSIVDKTIAEMCRELEMC